MRSIYQILMIALISIACSCTSGNESNIINGEAEQEDLNIEGVWELYNIELRTSKFAGVAPKNMESGDLVYYFTEDSLFIVSSARNLVLATPYIVEVDMLSYTSSDSEEEFDVSKKVSIKEGNLQLQQTGSSMGGIVHQFKPSEIDLEQLAYLQTNKVDWRMCAGNWIYNRYYPTGEEFDADGSGVEPLTYEAIEVLQLMAADSSFKVNQDTLVYWVDSPDSSTTFVYEIFRPKENGLDELHLIRVDPEDVPRSTLVYVIEQ